MVDVDKESFFQTLEQRPTHAVALEQDDSIVRRNGFGLNHAIGEGKVLINTRDAIVHDDFGVFAHDAQNLAAGKGRTDAVSIGSGVRGYNEAATHPNFL